jgi:hypothetical protein
MKSKLIILSRTRVGAGEEPFPLLDAFDRHIGSTKMSKIIAFAASLVVAVHALTSDLNLGSLHASLSRSTDAADRDRVESLPGVDSLHFNLYSG